MSIVSRLQIGSAPHLGSRITEPISVVPTVNPARLPSDRRSPRPDRPVRAGVRVVGRRYDDCDRAVDRHIAVEGPNASTPAGPRVGIHRHRSRYTASGLSAAFRRLLTPASQLLLGGAVEVHVAVAVHAQPVHGRKACPRAAGSCRPSRAAAPPLLLVARVLVGMNSPPHHLHGAVDEHVRARPPPRSERPHDRGQQPAGVEANRTGTFARCRGRDGLRDRVSPRVITPYDVGRVSPIDDRGPSSSRPSGQDRDLPCADRCG